MWRKGYWQLLKTAVQISGKEHAVHVHSPDPDDFRNLRQTSLCKDIRDANMFHNRVINFWSKLPDNCCVSSQYLEF